MLENSFATRNSMTCLRNSLYSRPDTTRKRKTRPPSSSRPTRPVSKHTKRLRPALRRLFSRVEEERGGSRDTAPFPLPAHRTGRARFGHPALRQGSSPDSRTSTHMHVTQTQHAQRSKDNVVRQTARAPRRDMVPLLQEAPGAFLDMLVDGPIRLQPGAVAEITRPAAQNAVQPVAHFRPCPLVAGHQHVVHLLSQSRHALLRRTGAQIPMAILPIVLWPERVSQKVKTLPPAIPKLGLRLVQGQAQARHHLPRPIARLGRMAASEDHEIVRVVDNFRLKSFSPSGDSPVLQEPIHVEVGEQGAGNPALRSSTAALSTSRHSPIPFLIPLLDRSFQPPLDQTQHVPIDDSLRHRMHQWAVGNGIEVFGQIRVDHIGVAFAEKFVHFLDRVLGAALRSVTISTGFQVRLEDRLQHQFGGGLHHPIADRGNTERPLPAPRLRDHHPEHRLRLVLLGAEFVPEFRQPLPPPLRFDLLEALPIDARRAFVGFRQFIGMGQNVFAVNLVVKEVEAIFRFVLRLAIQLPLKRPDLARCFQAHHQSPHLGLFESPPEVRALPSTGVTRLQRYFDPLRVPAGPLPLPRTLELASARTGVPPLAQITLPACRAHYPDGPSRCICRLLPGRCGLPRHSGGSASTTSLSRAAQAPKVAFVTRLLPAPLPDHAACQLPDLPTIIWVGLSPIGDLRRWAALNNPANRSSSREERFGLFSQPVTVQADCFQASRCRMAM